MMRGHHLQPVCEYMDNELKSMEGDTPMQQYYRGKSIFMTGATGFLGKVIMEKLLRSTEIDTLYILVRPKMGKDASSRIEEIFDDVIFQQLRTDRPKFTNKIVPIAGDCLLPALGISHTDRIRLVRNVNVVFHVAATVRFDEKLRIALQINVNGTKEILQLCKEIDALTACVYVSTAYANCNRPVIDECVYETPITPENILRLTECMDDKTLDAITPQLIGDWPNTYTYTKCLAEGVVIEMGKGLPITIFRPGIVVAAYNEPIAGWVGNMYGPVSIMIGIATGLLRVFYARTDMHAELVPVDMCVNSLLATAWDRATNNGPLSEIPVYNYVATPQNPITWQKFIDVIADQRKIIPFTNTVWYDTFTTVSSKTALWFLIFFYHTLPACCYDAGLVVMGKKPRMLEIYRKINRSSEVTRHFACNQWEFSNKNVQSLWQKLDARDKKIFFADMGSLDWDENIKKSMWCIRKYLMKDDPNTISAARIRLKRMKILHYFTIYTIYTILLFLLYVIASRLI